MKKITVLAVALLAAVLVRQAQSEELLAVLEAGDFITTVDTIELKVSGRTADSIVTSGFNAEPGMQDTFNFGDRRWPDEYFTVRYGYGIPPERKLPFTWPNPTQDSWYELPGMDKGQNNGRIKFKFPGGIEEERVRPRQALMLEAEPNPFAGRTEMRFSIASGSEVKVTVYDMTGQMVATVYRDRVGPGWHSFVWDGSDRSGRQVSEGVYLAKLAAGSDSFLTKLIKTD
ncbi:MAG: T9SS type A sorting domain-containing protein [candidate division WOR-3 bacterium]|nr:MAG: T9SS type A sorting domain-containing protein [candidate division WOR-3 bacterium]